jgi:TPR repeat protein
MNCPKCGHEGQPVGLGQTYECPGCGAVFVRPEGQSRTSCGDDGATDAELAEVTKLAQIRQRAAEARREKLDQAPPEEARPRRSGARRRLWAGVAAGLALAATAAGVYLTGAFVPHAAVASNDRDLRALAASGEVGAQFALGLLYDFGFQGSARDAEEAYRWYLKSAAAGDIDAQYFLGNWHRARSPRPDPAEAAYWITAAAEQGHPTAQATLADLYRVGEGVERDLEQAASWYTRAADQGSAVAHCGLARLYGGVETGYRSDPPVAATHDYVAKALGKDCGLSGYGASATLAKWTAEEGARRGKERIAKGFLRRPMK